MIPESLRLAANVAQALHPYAAQLARSLLGERESWSVDSCPNTELQVVDMQNWARSTQTLAHLLIPASPNRPPRWLRHRPSIKPVTRLFLRPSKVYRYSDESTRPDPTPDQAWFFVNGIGTDRNVLMLNAAYLARLFGRPFTLLHNSTCSLVPDLLECALGKGWDGVTEAVRVAFAPVYVALKSKRTERVILLAHSQGTIIASVLLWMFRALYPPSAASVIEGKADNPEQRVACLLARKWGFPIVERPGSVRNAVKPPLSREELGKLEIYGFANCASRMEPILGDGEHSIPYLESYGNEHDVVARLGVLAPTRGLGSARIGGARFQRPGTWGHLLNAHYLHPMEQAWRAAQKGQAEGAAVLEPLPGTPIGSPRLLEYFGGRSAAARAA